MFLIFKKFILHYFPTLVDLLLWVSYEKKDPYRIRIKSLVSNFTRAKAFDEKSLQEYSKFSRDVSSPSDLNKNVVLFLVHWYELGGAESFSLDTLRWANELGLYTIIIATVPSQHQHIELYQKFADELYYVDEQKSIYNSSFQTFLLDKIDEKKVDVIHIHHSTMGYEILPHIRKKYPSIKIVDTLHIVEYQTGGFPAISINFNQYINQTHVISQTLALYLIQEGVNKKKIVLQYLAKNIPELETNEKKIRTKYEKVLKQKKIRVAFIARLAFQKKPHVFIKLINKLNKKVFDHSKFDFEFIIFGDGLYRPYIEKKEKKIHNLHFFGEEFSSEKIFCDSDIVILPSRNEGITLTAFECSIAGVLFFATDVGSQAEFVPKLFMVPNQVFSYRNFKKKIIHFLKEPEPFIEELIKWRQKGISLLKYSVNKEWLSHLYRK